MEAQFQGTKCGGSDEDGLCLYICRLLYPQKKMNKKIFIARFLIMLSVVFVMMVNTSCGSSGSSADSKPVQNPQDEGNGADNQNNQDDETEILTEKLIGTPFEGKEAGDDFDCTFVNGKYFTETVDHLPIPIFLAFFTRKEERMVKEGIAIANQAAGEEVFEVVDKWSDSCRVIYKVNEIKFPNPRAGVNAAGITSIYTYYFDQKRSSASVISDWTIELETDDLDFKPIKWMVVHELGHALGIIHHKLIDYENDTWLELEENSIMEARVNYINELNDYTYMMQMQTEILKAHLNESQPENGVRDSGCAHL